MNTQLMNELKEDYGIVFHDVDLLEQAFTHSSYVNEHRNLHLSDNERLEFLGDAVLELIVSRYLYRELPDLPEGKLTKLRAAIVREDSLSMFAKDCRFDQYIRLGKGEENSGGRKRPSLLCDLFEAFLGALYLDQGLDERRRFLDGCVFPKVKAGGFFPLMMDSQDPIAGSLAAIWRCVHQLSFNERRRSCPRTNLLDRSLL